MADYVELKSNTSLSRSVREETAYPQVPHVLGTKITDLLAGKIAKALPADKYIYLQDVLVAGIVRAKMGDAWWKVYEYDGAPITGWVAERHLGQVLLTVTPITEPLTSHVVEVYVDGVLEFRKELP